jgi:nucleotide-binding universal stress UspA family protein
MRIAKILCPVDQSECSGKALRYAAALARSHGATLDVITVVINVIPPPVPELAMMPIVVTPELLAGSEQALKEFVTTCGATSVCSQVVEAPMPVTGIVGYARDINADLIVMGTHGWRGFDRLMFGSTTERVLHQAACPVLTVPPSTRDIAPNRDVRFDRILCACDFSPASVRALEWSRAFAQEHQGRVTLLHALEMLSAEDAHTVAHYRVAEYIGMRQQDAREELKALLPGDTGPWRDPCVRVEVGPADKAILRAAEEIGADLIAMGAQGHGTVASMLLGSTTHAVMRRATRPVLTVRA